MTDERIASALVSSGIAYRWSLLDPVDRFSEVLYGLFIALSITGSLSVGSGGAGNARLLLVGALGANVAWGIVDGVMYALGNLVRRARVGATERAIRSSHDAQRGRRLLAGALPGDVASVLADSELESIRRKIVAARPLPERPRLAREDVLGAGAVFLMVLLPTLPVVLPFVVVKDVQLALRISHAVAIVLLFLGGCALGRYAQLGSIRTGLAAMSVGVVLFVLTVALGG
jgi:hypothetical protein